MPVVATKVDCVVHVDLLCNYQQRIQEAYPTPRLFVDGAEPWHMGDINGHRTILEMEKHKQLLSVVIALLQITDFALLRLGIQKECFVFQIRCLRTTGR